VIVITDWSLEINRVNSADVFTSYAGIEVRLIVKQFKPSVTDKDKVTLTRYPVNLFRDDEIKTLIQNYIHECLSDAVNGAMKDESLPEIVKFNTKAKIDQGVVNFAGSPNFSLYGFKEGKTQIMDMVSIFKLEKGVTAFKKL